MNIKRWQELKQKLTHEPDLGKIWLFYMDHFSDHVEFTNLGQPCHNRYLADVVLKSCEELFGKTTPLTNLLLIYIAEHQFFHGPLEIQGRFGGVIYFEDVKVGLIAVSATFPPTDEVKYLRFSEAGRFSTPNRHDLN